jgi:hypothetical protein
MPQLIHQAKGLKRDLVPEAAGPFLGKKSADTASNLGITLYL